MLLHKKNVRYLLLIFLGLAGIALGYLRWTYIIIWEGGFKLVRRASLYSQYNYPETFSGLWRSMLHDPRWISGIVYFITPFLLSLASVYLVFLKYSYVQKVIRVYIFSWGLLAFLFSLSLIFSSYQVGIGIAQNIKHLIQTPFFSLLLIAAFKMDEMVKENA